MIPNVTRAHGARPGPLPERRPFVAAAVVCSLAVSPALVQAQLAAGPEASATIVGRVCLVSEPADRCPADALPAPGLVVRAPGGLRAVTDAEGRFHLAAVPGRTLAADPAGAPILRLPQIALTVDVAPLGPAATAPAPVWVDPVPGSVASVDLVVHLPGAPPSPDAVAGAATRQAPAIELREEGLRFHVPLALPADHAVEADGRRLVQGADGIRFVPVLVGEREGAAVVVDRAPSGRTRLFRQRVLRVPRPRGGDLFVPEPLVLLAILDLPPAPVAPGPLRVLVQAPSGTALTVGDAEPATVGAEGRRALRVPVPGDGRLRIHVAPPDAPGAEAELILAVDARAADLAFGAVDLRVGLSPGSVFAEGGLWAEGRRRFLGGTLFGGLSLGEDDVDRWIGGGRLLAARRPVVGRWPDPVATGAFFGDESRTVDENPAGLPLFGGWEGSAGRVALGAGRTELSGGEVGRFDRPVIGPVVDLALPAGPVALRLHGGADLGGTPLLEPTGLAFARAELEGTGGAVYWLPHRHLAQGSERVWIESRDPRTGLVAARRLLVRGVDYHVDYPTGRLHLARPAGFHGTPMGGRLSAAGLGYGSVVVVDYAHLAPPGSAPDVGHGALRLSAAAHGVEVGLRGAGTRGSFLGDHGLAGIDVHAEPLPWLSVAGSVARSRGDPFGTAARFLRSADGGIDFEAAPPVPGGIIVPSGGPTGHASALRFRLGDADHGITGWWKDRSEGYGDGALPVEGGRRQLGGAGHTEVAGVSVEALVDHRRADVGDLEDARTEIAGRAARRFGPVTVAAEGLHRRGRVSRVRTPPGESPMPTVPAEGAVTAAGAEITWHATERLDLSAGHLQAVHLDDTLLDVGDPTLTSVAVNARLLADDRVEIRGGVRPDLSPVLLARWDRDAGEGTMAYGGIDAGARPAFDEDRRISVSGARRIHAPGVMTFAEQRTVTDDAGPWTGQAVGFDVDEGPWRIAAAYERGARLGDDPDAVRDGLHGALGLRVGNVDVDAFGEVIRAPSLDEDGHLRSWHAGIAARARPLPTLSLGGHLFTGNVSGPVARARLPGRAPSHEALLGGAWRPTTDGPLRPALFFHYGLRQERPLSTGVRLDVPERRQYARLNLVLGTLPGPEIRLTALGGTHALVGAPLAGTTTRTGVLSARVGWPMGLVEPAVEAGGRWITGAGLPTRSEPTVRAELLAVLGPARVGVGGVLTGFAGTGLEEGDETPPRVYVVVRAAVQ